MKKWMLKGGKADLNKISSELGIEKAIARILVNRDIKFEEMENFLYGEILHDPSKMKDMDKATKLIIESIRKKEKIRIVGDYDQDGVSSVSIMIRALKKLDAIVDYRIPDRMKDGYGINENIVEEAKKENIKLIITCDNGIAAFEAVERAKALDLNIIITDHHDIPIFLEGEKEKYMIPKADAVINPKRKDCNYPFDSLCGASVALKLCENLFKNLGKDKRELSNLYQFAAMATICDVVDLIDENRIIVKKGLKVINQTDNIGLKCLIEASNLKDKEIGVYHLGFILGPCINASGRLKTANEAVELFTTEDAIKAKKLAKTLVELNEERKELTQKGLEETVDIIKKEKLLDNNIIVVFNSNIHESIAGIIAGRIKDMYYRPTIVLTKANEEGFAKGSGRSIEEFDMFKEMSKIKDLFERFGGHPMAAGVTLKNSNIDTFRDKINENSKLTKEDLTEKIYIDINMPVDKIKLNLPKRLEILEPFGKGNRKPLFGDKRLKINRLMVLGSNYKIIKMFLVKNNIEIESIYFGDIDKFQEYLKTKYGEDELKKAMIGMKNDIEIDIIYYPSINEYKGNRNLQIVISDYR